MATNADSAATALANAWARLAELDAMSIDERARFNYTAPNGIAFGWSDYRASLLATIKGLSDAPKGGSSLVQQAAGPWTVLG